MFQDDIVMRSSPVQRWTQVEAKCVCGEPAIQPLSAQARYSQEASVDCQASQLVSLAIVESEIVA